MKKFPLLLLAVALSVPLFAQLDPSKVSAATRSYRTYRLKETQPTFGIRKVRALVKHIKADKEDNERLSDAVYNKLSTAEKFTYCMIHGEDQSQNCEEMPWVKDEEKMIFGHIPGSWSDEAVWSERQRAFLKNHRSEVLGLVRSTIRSSGRVGLNTKHVILETEAIELVPDLVKVYRANHKDKDILSTLMLLMKDGNYKPFMESASYKKLYADEANWQAYLNGNSENQNLIMDRAMAFYKSRGK